MIFARHQDPAVDWQPMGLTKTNESGEQHKRVNRLDDRRLLCAVGRDKRQHQTTT